MHECRPQRVRKQLRRGADDCPSANRCRHGSDLAEVKSPIVDQDRQVFRAGVGSMQMYSVLFSDCFSMRDLDPLIGIVSCAAACLVFWLVVLLVYWS